MQDIIAAGSQNKKVDTQAIVRLFQSALENWDTDIYNIVKQHVTKIYAHADGTFTVNIGVHMNGCGGRI